MAGRGLVRRHQCGVGGRPSSRARRSSTAGVRATPPSIRSTGRAAAPRRSNGKGRPRGSVGSSRRLIAGWKTGWPRPPRRQDTPEWKESEVRACRLRRSISPAAASCESSRGTGPAGGWTTSGGPWRRRARSKTASGSSPGEAARGRGGASGAGLAAADDLDPAGGHLGGAPQAAAVGDGDAAVGPAEPGRLAPGRQALQQLAGLARRHRRQGGVAQPGGGDGRVVARRRLGRRRGGREARLGHGVADGVLQVREAGDAGAVQARAARLADPHQDRALVDLVAVAPALAVALLAAAGLEPGDLRDLGRRAVQQVVEARHDLAERHRTVGKHSRESTSSLLKIQRLSVFRVACSLQTLGWAKGGTSWEKD